MCPRCTTDCRQVPQSEKTELESRSFCPNSQSPKCSGPRSQNHFPFPILNCRLVVSVVHSCPEGKSPHGSAPQVSRFPAKSAITYLRVFSLGSDAFSQGRDFSLPRAVIIRIRWSFLWIGLHVMTSVHEGIGPIETWRQSGCGASQILPAVCVTNVTARYKPVVFPLSFL